MVDRNRTSRPSIRNRRRLIRVLDHGVAFPTRLDPFRMGDRISGCEARFWPKFRGGSRVMQEKGET